MNTNYNQQEKTSFKSFLVFSFLLTTFINLGFSLNSSQFRVNEVELINDSLTFQKNEFTNIVFGHSIWTVSNDTFSDIIIQYPTIENITVSKSYPNKIFLEIKEYDEIITITDLRGSIPKRTILYKNMIEIPTDSKFMTATLTITNGPVDIGLNGELISLIMTLKSYSLNEVDFKFTFDGDKLIGEYRDSEILFGPALDLGTKAAALGALLEDSYCNGTIRFIGSEDIIAEC